MHPTLDLFEQSAATFGDKLAAADQSLQLTYGALNAVARGLGQRIAETTAAQRVGIATPASAAGAAAIYATWYAGKTPVPLNFLLERASLAEVIRDAGLDTIVGIQKLVEPFAAFGLKTIEISGETLVPGTLKAPTAQATDTGAVIYTSGTTGGLKGVELTFSNLVSNAHAAIEHAGITPKESLLSVLPQFHSFGFTTLTVTPLCCGATVWYLPRFSPVAVVNTIHERGVSIFVATASLYAALLKLKNAPDDALRSLRLAVSGGEPLSAKVAAAFKQRFGIEISEGYGLTETSPVVSIQLPGENRPGSVGRALPGVEVFAVDDEKRRVEAGTEGELAVTGTGVMRGYLNKPDATREVLRDGVLYTGDAGRVDADGFIYITGRVKDMMIVGGENVFPREIEAAIEQHPAVAEAAVVGAPDESRGEVPVAFVTLREGASVDPIELRDFCRDKLAGYKVPREAFVIEELPRGPTGKILKRALLERLKAN
ncbi:MAG: AMP-binding protein [Phycisphaerales bacterium]|nr:AMP-binding protein [Phycisphaerales bacterium]